jgi:hypothetical protein
MKTAHINAPGALRSWTRTLIILAVAVAMFAVAAVPPALATGDSGGEGDGDIAKVRAEVTETYTYKIGLLTEKMNGTDNADKMAVYAEGIAQLVDLRDGRVATEDNIEELWGLNQKAHDIYHATKARASEVGETPTDKLEKAKKNAREAVEYKTGLLNEWEGCDAKLATDQIAKGVSQLKALYPKIDNAETPDAAYSVKDQAYSIYHSTVDKAESACEGEDPRTKEEIAAEELRDVRSSTLEVIERKAAILSAAAEAARNPVVAAIFASAAQEVAGLEDAARSAKTVGALKDLKAKAVEIYNIARDSVAELRGEDEADEHDKDPARDIESHLTKIADWVDHLTKIAERTAAESPDTFSAVEDAASDVHDAITAVMEVAGSGKRLHTKWQDLSVAVKNFKRAFAAHHVAVWDAPACYGTFHIPG